MGTILTELQSCVLNRLMEGLLQEQSCNNTYIDESCVCVCARSEQFRSTNTKAALISAFLWQLKLLFAD